MMLIWEYSYHKELQSNESYYLHDLYFGCFKDGSWLLLVFIFWWQIIYFTDTLLQMEKEISIS